MNERIQEQARQYANENCPGSFVKYNPEWFAFYNKKFAELLVAECINKIETHQIPVGNSAAGEMACEWTYAALKEIRDEIKQHFGVE